MQHQYPLCLTFIYLRHINVFYITSYICETDFIVYPFLTLCKAFSSSRRSVNNSHITELFLIVQHVILLSSTNLCRTSSLITIQSLQGGNKCCNSVSTKFGENN